MSHESSPCRLDPRKKWSKIKLSYNSWIHSIISSPFFSPYLRCPLVSPSLPLPYPRSARDLRLSLSPFSPPGPFSTLIRTCRGAPGYGEMSGVRTLTLDTLDTLGMEIFRKKMASRIWISETKRISPRFDLIELLTPSLHILWTHRPCACPNLVHTGLNALHIFIWARQLR